MPSLGLIMILCNEEKNLSRSLKPVAGLFDEIVAVDTGSNDNTIESAETMGASVYKLKWAEDFSAARNFSISKAKADFLFWLDGDNAITENSVAAIRRVLESENQEFIGWCREVLEPRGGSLIQKRLFPRRSDIFFSGRIHEQLSHPDHLKYVYLNVDILHWGYRDPVDAKAKGLRNLKILYESLKSNRDDFYLLYQTGKTLFNLKKYREAKKYLSRAVAGGTGRPENPELTSHALILQGLVLERLGNPKATVVFEKAIQSGLPGQRLALFHLGRILADKGDFEAAIHNLELFLAEQTEYLTLDVDLEKLAFRASVLLARLYRAKGHMQKSVSCLYRAVGMEPKTPFPYRELVKTLSAMDRIEEAEKVLEKLIRINPDDRSIGQLRNRLIVQAPDSAS